MKYQLIIKVPFEAMDDIAARQKAKQYAKEVKAIAPDADEKLQEVYSDKPPRGINIK